MLKQTTKNKAVEENLKNSNLDFELSTLYRSQDRYNEAISKIKNLISMPSQVGYRCILLDIYFENQHIEQSLLKIDEILLSGGFSRHFYYLVLVLKIECLMTLNQVEPAFATIEQAQDIFMEDELLAWKGLAYLKVNEIDKAKMQFDRSLVFNTRNEKAWMGIGSVHCLKGDKELGLSCYKKVQDINVDSQVALQLIEKFELKGAVL